MKSLKKSLKNESLCQETSRKLVFLEQRKLNRSDILSDAGKIMIQYSLPPNSVLLIPSSQYLSYLLQSTLLFS